MKKKIDRAFNLNYIREHNVKVISNLLYEKPYSCLELANEIKISDVAVNKIIKQLLSIGMVKRFKEEEKSKTIGGQHIRYTLNKYVGLYVCVDFTQYQDVAFIYDFAGNVLKIIELEVSNVATKEEIIRAIDLIKKGLDGINSKYNKVVLGVALAVPGQVNENNNAFLYSGKFESFENDELYRMFEETFHTHIIMKNNVHLMAMGEYEKGNLTNKYNIATYLYVGSGIAMCVIYDGKCITGWRGYAGEVGGNRYNSTTLSLSASLDRLREKASKIIGRTIRYHELFELFENNEDFHKIVIDSTNALGETIINASNLVGCNLFMIGGDALKFGDEYFDMIQKYISRYSVNNAKIIKNVENKATIIGCMKLLREYACLEYYKNKVSVE